MKKISQRDLNKLRSRGGVTVKRRLGTKEKPESEVVAEAASSGTEEATAPALASTEFLTVMGKMTDLLARIEARDAPKVIPAKVKKVKTEPALVKAPGMLDAAKKASVKSNQVDRPFQMLRKLGMVQHAAPVPETKIIEVKSKSEWKHVPVRDDSGYMSQIVSTDQFGNEWIHDMVRSGKKLIEEIISKSNTGLQYLHLIHRSDNLIDVVSTEAQA